ncbi:hypothetical protein PGT21_005370 [Puccinia graminis f. sp. tritici]|uniref:Uncharacterized protein n=1 Tax=Puccinia graminis f. sp. tritici TaxID=56615 RepID=A0A5B0MBK5_PUCGR|nr:hypothetical protein PGT21_005370 [Puccinia graminis f. sp. tritici]
MFEFSTSLVESKGNPTELAEAKLKSRRTKACSSNRPIKFLIHRRIPSSRRLHSTSMKDRCIWVSTYKLAVFWDQS